MPAVQLSQLSQCFPQEEQFKGTKADSSRFCPLPIAQLDKLINEFEYMPHGFYCGSRRTNTIPTEATGVTSVGSTFS